MGQSELRSQALRINARYLSEVVEAFDLCPWASSVSDGAGLSRQVFLSTEDSPAARDEVAGRIEELSKQSEIDIGLFIFPSLAITPQGFRSFVAAMESAHASAHPRGAMPFAMADFHPDAPLDTSSAARLVGFIRRAPDPTIQLVRRSAMAKVRSTEDEGSVFAESLASFLPLQGSAPKPSVSDNIARNNLRTVQKVGSQHIEKILQDIACDRAEAYKRSS